MNQFYAHGGDVVVFLVHLLIIFSFFTLSQLAMRSEGRYLRPADHGLLTAYQNSTTPPTRDNVPQQQQMSSFFNGGKPVQSNLPLPEAKNITTMSGGAGVGVENDDWWKRRIRSRDKGSRDHLKEVLLVASLVCGLAGVIFLAVSGAIFLSRWRKERRVSQSTSTLALTGDAAGATNKS